MNTLNNHHTYIQKTVQPMEWIHTNDQPRTVAVTAHLHTKNSSVDIGEIVKIPEDRAMQFPVLAKALSFGGEKKDRLSFTFESDVESGQAIEEEKAFYTKLCEEFGSFLKEPEAFSVLHIDDFNLLWHLFATARTYEISPLAHLVAERLTTEVNTSSVEVDAPSFLTCLDQAEDFPELKRALLTRLVESLTSNDGGLAQKLLQHPSLKNPVFRKKCTDILLLHVVRSFIEENSLSLLNKVLRNIPELSSHKLFENKQRVHNFYHDRRDREPQSGSVHRFFYGVQGVSSDRSDLQRIYHREEMAYLITTPMGVFKDLVHKQAELHNAQYDVYFEKGEHRIQPYAAFPIDFYLSQHRDCPLVLKKRTSVSKVHLQALDDIELQERVWQAMQSIEYYTDVVDSMTCEIVIGTQQLREDIEILQNIEAELPLELLLESYAQQGERILHAALFQNQLAQLEWDYVAPHLSDSQRYWFEQHHGSFMNRFNRVLEKIYARNIDGEETIETYTQRLSDILDLLSEFTYQWGGFSEGALRYFSDITECAQHCFTSLLQRDVL